MQFIDDLEALEQHYGKPGSGSLRKVVNRLTPLYRDWIMSARYCVVSTVGPEGVDGSPRGDDGPVVCELDAQTLAMPDWRGNNRLDSLRNIVRDERIALMFMVPGADNVVRVNGAARLTADEDLRQRFAKNGKIPATVVVIRIAEIYAQCARAQMRAGLWSGQDAAAPLPTMGQLMAEASDGAEGGAEYDVEWRARAPKTMW